MKCAPDICNCLYANVMLFDSVAMLQKIGEQRPNECDKRHAEDFFVSVSGDSECQSQLGRKASPS